MSGVPVPPAYGIIVPVRDEAAILPVTVPRLLAATAGEAVRILWVCNGCRDDSAGVIRHIAGPAAEVIALPCPGKTAALQAGDDALAGLFPRLYLNADVWLRPGDPARLMRVLTSGAADLVAPRLHLDAAGASAVSARIGACWLSLPHAQGTAFGGAMGVSAGARGLWGRWPAIAGDDIFAAAMVPAHRRQIVAGALATTSMPRDFAGWVRMRARWLRAEAELARLGLMPVRPMGQRQALLRRLLTPRAAAGARAFVAARLLARMAMNEAASPAWLPERAASPGHLHP